MEVKDKVIIGLLSAILVASLVVVFSGKTASLGAYDESYTNFTKLKATSAFISEATNTVFNSGATSTVAVGGTAGVGKVCVFNGTNFSVISFAAGATTTSVATSTTCQ